VGTRVCAFARLRRHRIKQSSIPSSEEEGKALS
jgi:hypothetical protein